MSIAINLLPDVRLARLRAQHVRHLVTGIAVAIWIVVAIIVGGMFGMIGAQKLVLSNVNNQIAKNTAKIQSTSGLTMALTTQSTLRTLPSLYGSRSYFSKFMPVITGAMPANLTISNISSDSTGLLTITGTASSAYAIDQFYEALKLSGSQSAGGAYFSGVTINGVGKDATTGLDSFTLTATMSPGAISG